MFITNRFCEVVLNLTIIFRKKKKFKSKFMFFFFQKKTLYLYVISCFYFSRDENQTCFFRKGIKLHTSRFTTYIRIFNVCVFEGNVLYIYIYVSYYTHSTYKRDNMINFFKKIFFLVSSKKKNLQKNI